MPLYPRLHGEHHLSFSNSIIALPLPRLRGENGTNIISEVIYTPLPPPTRGTLDLSLSSTWVASLYPAYTGNTLPISC